MDWTGIGIPDTFLDASELDGDTIGFSEEKRPIRGTVLGTGPRKVSLLAGAHADEPVGPTTLRTLIRALGQTSGGADRSHPIVHELLYACTISIIPHVNPDGEARNAAWRREWPNPEAYIRDVVREEPGRDIEFGYPDMRVENEIVSRFLEQNGPFHVHASLHGMGFSDGAMLLIEKNWAYRSEQLQAAFVRKAGQFGLRLHDHNRKGEKGFFRIAKGFTTTPEGEAMRRFFLSHGNPEMAGRFRQSSMEFVRTLGGDPLSIVTELPLFTVDGEALPEVPTAYLAFKELLPEIRLGLAKGRDVYDLWQPFGLHHVPVEIAVELQLEAILWAIRTAT